MAEKLTDARVRAAKPRDKRYSIMDAREPGLELRLHIDGRRVFALRRSVGGKDLRVTLGEYSAPPMLSLVGARSQAAELKIKFRTQGDFRDREQREAEERRLREAYTIENLAADWVTHAKNRLRASTNFALPGERISMKVQDRRDTRKHPLVKNAEFARVVFDR
jgi:hypothetical protein